MEPDAYLAPGGCVVSLTTIALFVNRVFVSQVAPTDRKSGVPADCGRCEIDRGREPRRIVAACK